MICLPWINKDLIFIIMIRDPGEWYSVSLRVEMCRRDSESLTLN